MGSNWWLPIEVPDVAGGDDDASSGHILCVNRSGVDFGWFCYPGMVYEDHSGIFWESFGHVLGQLAERVSGMFAWHDV